MMTRAKSPVTAASLMLLACTCCASLVNAAETRYITDEFEVTMRSGTSTSNGIVQMLRSGDAVTVLEDDLASKYSLVETAGKRKGYVLSRFLMEHPAARQNLLKLQADFDRQRGRIDEQSDEITGLEQTLSQEKSDNQALKSTLRASEQELFEIRAAARDSLETLEQNRHLESLVEQLRNEKIELSSANAELSDSTRLDWFVRGGAMSLAAFVIGILVTRIRWRKQDSWGSY